MLNDGGTTDSVRTLPRGRSAGRAYPLDPLILGSRTRPGVQIATARSGGVPRWVVHAPSGHTGAGGYHLRRVGLLRMGASRRFRRLSTSAALALVLAFAGAAAPVGRSGGPAGSQAAAALAGATAGQPGAQP